MVDLLPPRRHQESHLRPLQPRLLRLRLLLLRRRVPIRLLEDVLDEELGRGVRSLVDDALDEEVAVRVNLDGHF